MLIDTDYWKLTRTLIKERYCQFSSALKSRGTIEVHHSMFLSSILCIILCDRDYRWISLLRFSDVQFTFLFHCGAQFGNQHLCIGQDCSTVPTFRVDYSLSGMCDSIFDADLSLVHFHSPFY